MPESIAHAGKPDPCAIGPHVAQRVHDCERTTPEGLEPSIDPQPVHAAIRASYDPAIEHRGIDAHWSELVEFDLLDCSNARSRIRDLGPTEAAVETEMHPAPHAGRGEQRFGVRWVNRDVPNLGID